MSFFKDFKEDLSQAVNELLPEEKSEEPITLAEDIMDDQPQMVDTISESDAVFDKSDIADLLNNMEAASSNEEHESFMEFMPEKEVSVPDSVMSDLFAETKSEPDEEPDSIEKKQVRQPVFVTFEHPEKKAEPVEEKIDFSEPEIFEKEEPAIEMPVEEQPREALLEEPSVQEAEFDSSEVPLMQSATESLVSDSKPVEEERVQVTPVFANEQVERPAPINTTMEERKMETGTMEIGTIIAGMSVKGDILSEGSLEVKGNVSGNIEIKGKLEITGSIEGNSSAEEVFADGAKIVGEIHSSGSVKIGQSSVVKGNISAMSAVLAGAVKGDIDVQGPVILDTTAIIMGNIKSKSIQINNGAVIEGLCSQCYADVSPLSFFDEDDKTAKVNNLKSE